MVLVLFFVITVLVMIIIYGNIQPSGLILSVHRKTVNTIELGTAVNVSDLNVTNTAVNATTSRPPLIRGTQKDIMDKFEPGDLFVPTENNSNSTLEIDLDGPTPHSVFPIWIEAMGITKFPDSSATEKGSTMMAKMMTKPDSTRKRIRTKTSQSLLETTQAMSENTNAFSNDPNSIHEETTLSPPFNDNATVQEGVKVDVSTTKSEKFSSASSTVSSSSISSTDSRFPTSSMPLSMTSSFIFSSNTDTSVPSTLSPALTPSLQARRSGRPETPSATTSPTPSPTFTMESEAALEKQDEVRSALKQKLFKLLDFLAQKSNETSETQTD